MASETPHTAVEHIALARHCIRLALRSLVEQGGSLSLRDELHRCAVRLDLINEAIAIGMQEAQETDRGVTFRVTM